MSDVFKEDIFKGRVVLATGGGSGIVGLLRAKPTPATHAQQVRGIVLQMMRHGANAAIIGRRKQVIEEAAQSLSESTGNTCIGVSADVRNLEALTAAAAQAADKFGRIDYVICGAAGNFLAPVEALSANAFATVVNIDLLGTYNTVKATLPHLKKSKGSYVHITATLPYTGVHLQAHVSAAKAGIHALSQVMAVELGPLGIRSNCLLPGFTEDTEGMSRLSTKDSRATLARAVPVQRLTRKVDLAYAAMFLFSEAASNITGVELICDGGSWHRGQSVMPYPESVLDAGTFREQLKSKL